MARKSAESVDRALLLALVDEAFDRRAWHGPNLRGSIRRVTPEQAVWRPRSGRRNIVEIVMHCAYWKYAVRRRIRGDKRGSFPLKGSNWFESPARLSPDEWRGLAKLLEQQHHELRDAIERAPWSTLRSARKGTAPTAAHVHGVAMHDLYHAGQIQTIKALYKNDHGAR
jgi:hypothetical protein